MASSHCIRFDETDGGILLRDAAALLPLMRDILPFWRFRALSALDAPFLTVTGGRKGHTLSSPFLARDKHYSEPVDAVCAIIVELAWSHLRAHEEFLCLHGGGIEIGGNLVVIPSTYRAGKSTLTACLAKQGHRVFSDDFLPLRIADDGRIMGFASGIRPRVRLPLPDGFSDAMADFAERGAPLQSPRYRYLDLPENLLATRGEERPVGAIVVLDRRDDGPAELGELGRAEALKTLVRQNFSRALNAGNILRLMYFLAMKAPAFTLRFSDAEEAAALLSREMPGRNLAAPSVPEALRRRFTEDQPDLEAERSRTAFEPGARYGQAAGISVFQVDDRHFLADEAGYGIFELNETSGAVWSALKAPSRAAEIAELFTIAFPDIPADRIATDIDRIMRHLAWSNLIRKADAGDSPQDAETAGEIVR